MIKSHWSTGLLRTLLLTLFSLAASPLPTFAVEAESPVETDWRFEASTLKVHDKAYSAGKFILFPAKEHRFVIVTSRVTGTRADPMSIDELAAVQKLSAADKKTLRETLIGDYRCFDMSKLALIDSSGSRHPALWNTDDSIATSVETLAGTALTRGRDPEHWTRTKRGAVKLSKEEKAKLVKAGTLSATHPDFRTSFSGLLKVDQTVEISFVFQLPEAEIGDGWQLAHGGAESARDGQVAQSGRKPGNAASATKAPSGKPNWQVEEIRLRQFGAASFARDQVSLTPAQGDSFVEVSFKMTALTADAKALDAYLRTWNNADRTGLSKRLATGVRYFDSRNLWLVGPDGARYSARWNLNEGIRTSIHTSDISPNSTASHSSSRGTTNPSGIWLDAEQSYLVRTTRPLNRPPIVEHVTLFAGIMATNRVADVTFLFSVPTTVDHGKLMLELDSFAYPLAKSTTAAE